jgi:hypothetical protein
MRIGPASINTAPTVMHQDGSMAVAGRAAFHVKSNAAPIAVMYPPTVVGLMFAVSIPSFINLFSFGNYRETITYSTV